MVKPWVLAVPTLLLVASSASAAPSSAEEKTAAQLFTEGRAAMESKDWATACPKFEASLKLVKRSGTLFALSKCAEKDKHLVKAAELCREGIGMLPAGDDRLAESKQVLVSLEARIAHLTVNLPADAPPGTTVTLDDAPAQIGTSVAVDPGQHTWVSQAPGRSQRRGSLNLAEAEQNTITVELALPTDTAPSAAAPSAPPAQKAGLSRTVAYVVGGVGVASLIAGAVTGGLTIGKKSDADKNCTATSCNQAGIDAESSGKTLSTISTITFIAGGVGVGAGVVLFLVSKPKAPGAEPAPVALDVAPTLGGASLALRGAF